MVKSQKTNRDHAKKTIRPMVEDDAIASQLSALLTPAITSQENYYRQLGLRARILNLPLMVSCHAFKLHIQGGRDAHPTRLRLFVDILFKY